MQAWGTQDTLTGELPIINGYNLYVKEKIFEKKIITRS